jgi:hypothetical protein
MNLCSCGCGLRVRNKWHIGHNRRGVPPTNKIGGTLNLGYRLIWIPSHPRANKQGYVREHHVVMERSIGRYLKFGEVVHHKNGDRSDNKIENLQLMTKVEHDRQSVLISEQCLLCDKKHKARGLCGSCYGKAYRGSIWFPRAPSRGNRWSSKKALIIHEEGRSQLMPDVFEDLIIDLIKIFKEEEAS